jgi:hypothetical protein
MQMARSIVGVVLASVVLFGISSGRDLVWLALPRSAQYRLCLRDAAPILGPRVADRIQKRQEELADWMEKNSPPEHLTVELEDKLLSQVGKGLSIPALEETCAQVALLNFETMLELRGLASPPSKRESSHPQ